MKPSINKFPLFLYTSVVSSLHPSFTLYHKLELDHKEQNTAKKQKKGKAKKQDKSILMGKR